MRPGTGVQNPEGEPVTEAWTSEPPNHQALSSVSSTTVADVPLQ